MYFLVSLLCDCQPGTIMIKVACQLPAIDMIFIAAVGISYHRSEDKLLCIVCPR